MIKYLDGVRETVGFENNSSLMLFDNTDYEEYPVHWHTPIELIMPTEGTYDVDCNQIPFHMRKGDIIVIIPGTLHHMKACHGRRIIFQVDMNSGKPFEEFTAFLPFLQPAVLITPEEAPAIHEEAMSLMFGIRDEYLSDTPLYETSVYAKFLQLIVLIGRQIASTPAKFADTKPTKQKEYIDKFISICQYINQHCTEDITLEQVAALAGFSKYHFSRLFKEFTNISFYKYLNNQRISYAEKILLDPNINITEVAIHSGYNSISAFMRMFKIIKNCTPTEFRNMYQS